MISGGRAIHAVGAGWNEEEATAYGYDFPPLGKRFERLEDGLNIARAMFTHVARRPTRAHTTASAAPSTTRSRSAATSRS